MSPIKYKPEGDENFRYDGWTLSREEIKDLKRELASDPADVSIRLLLMSYFGGGPSVRFNAVMYHRHLDWMIENHPRHPVHNSSRVHSGDLYKSGKNLWLRQIRLNPDDVTILVHAASYLSFNDRENAVKFLSRADILDPENEDIPRQLSRVYHLMAGHYSSRKNTLLAKKSAQQMIEAVRRYAASSELGTYLMVYFNMELTIAADCALFYKLVDEARELGELLMNLRSIDSKKLAPDVIEKSRWRYVESENLAHLFLGRAALIAGDAESAIDHLWRKVTIEYDWFPKWKLAAELIDTGEPKAVSAFIEFGKSVWTQRLNDLKCRNPVSSEEHKADMKVAKQMIKWLREMERD